MSIKGGSFSTSFRRICGIAPVLRRNAATPHTDALEERIRALLSESWGISWQAQRVQKAGDADTTTPRSTASGHT